MSQRFVGVDVSKKEIHVCVLGKKTHPCPNCLAGFRKMMKSLREKESQGEETIFHIGMEATGVYHLKLATFLKGEPDVVVYVMNPAQVRSFFQASFHRTKTDSIDACGIASCTEFLVSRGKIRAFETPDNEVERLRQLCSRREDLLSMVQMEKNRLEALKEVPSHSRDAERSILEHIEFLNRRLEDIEEKIKGHIQNSPELKEQADLLKSIPGISDTSAAALISEIRCAERFSDVKELVAFAGLAPAERISGTSVKGKTSICKTGSSRLRKHLYMPALVGIRHNPLLKEFYERLTNRNKPKKAALIACMRKLLHIIYGVLKNRTAFDPLWAKNRLAMAC